MYLKTLTLKGFKSFASSTTLHLAPGITCLVGPNGSGKSNVVDALAWVMGEQGAKSLRGGKMDDVVFAGTAARPALGRAEVTLTIDNSDGALPTEFAEVTLRRTMFRTGGSEYSLNGSACRLLDIQELLADSGIGREMHVIVGQGQLDAVLSAGAEDRRGLVEEAAGVLKHRKRKEKALRKLEAMQANLTRLQDLTAELRRQLAPLGRQAEVARRAATIQSDVRDARARLLADDLVQMRDLLAREQAAEADGRARRDQAERALAEARDVENGLEQVRRDRAAASEAARETVHRLTSLRERLGGTARLAAERVRNLTTDSGDGPRGRDPQALEQEAQRIREHEAALLAEAVGLAERVERAVRERQRAESALADEDARRAALARAAADRREGLARLAGTVAAARTRLETRRGEIDRLRAAARDASARADQASRRFLELEQQVATLDEGEVDLDAEYEQAEAERRVVEDELDEAARRENAIERSRAALTARLDALAESLTPADGAAALLEAARSGDVCGVKAAMSGLLSVEAGGESAISAALGVSADALVVSGVEGAVQAIRWLGEQDAGRVELVVEADDSTSRALIVEGEQLPPGARPALDLVAAPPRLTGAIRALLGHVVVVPDLDGARQVVERFPALAAVTLAGDLVAGSVASGGSAPVPSSLEVAARMEAGRAQLEGLVAESERLRFTVARLRESETRARGRAESALASLHESDARLAAIAEQLGQLGSVARAAGAEAQRLSAALAQAEEQAQADASSLAQLQDRLRAASELEDRGASGSPSSEGNEVDRDRLAAAAADCRAAEMQARLDRRTAEERAAALAGRAQSLRNAAAAEREARAAASRRRARRSAEADRARAVGRGAAAALGRLESSLLAALGERDAADSARKRADGELAAVRDTIRRLQAEVERIAGSLHKDEVARAEQQLRVETLSARARDELGLDPQSLVESFGPAVPVPTASAEAPDAPAVPFVRAAQEKRLRAAERALAQLGKINPLALEEFAALEQRHSFLSEQLEDLKATRRDLLAIIRDVDERVEQVFASAFADISREFERVFARLFPGGEGRLVLTQPDDMLTTGIEVEARPAGKRVKRLSLLSGGERSLTAVALLVAIFIARPSPFYVLDEVEAALDDTNLGRLLDIFEELRASSQLLVVTHQKRTMSIADTLYGVTMRGDGVTTVISQRLREAASA